jgi:hypothetical protein
MLERFIGREIADGARGALGADILRDVDDVK